MVGWISKSSIFMHSKKLTSWFLLAFVVLFWNLGPSLHHADLFGLHSSASGNSFSCCCCCSHHHPVDSEDGESPDLIGQDGHCSLCDYFDQLHLVVEAGSNTESVQFFAWVAVLSDKGVQSGTISPQARGPPLA